MTAPVAFANQKVMFNKTEAEYNMKSIRFLLLTITAMFFVIAGVMIVLGMSVYGHYHNFTFFYETAKTGHFMTPSVLCVLLGLVLIVVSLFGFFGSFKQSTCMVNSYAILLILILIMQMVAVILAFTLNQDQIVKLLYIPVEDYTTDSEIQNEMDSLQSSLGCCGSNSYMDYLGMEFTSNHSTVVVSKETDSEVITIVIPSSCCVTSGDVFCSRMWSTGCKHVLVDVLYQNATVIGVLGMSVMVINLLGIVFALLLARCIRKMKSERALLMWKIKEQFIMARKAEEEMKNQSQVYIEEQSSSVA